MDENDKTRVTKLMDVGHGWRAYRVKTRSTNYHLAVRDGAGGERPCVVLRGYSHGREVDVTDSAPQVGGRLLFQVPTADWIGKMLAVGTVETSPVTAVEEEKSLAVIHDITGTLARPATRSEPEAAPQLMYPENMVEQLEAAASVLRRTYRHARLLDDLKSHEHLVGRFKAALAECALHVAGLRDRLGQ